MKYFIDYILYINQKYNYIMIIYDHLETALENCMITTMEKMVFQNDICLKYMKKRLIYWTSKPHDKKSL